MMDADDARRWLAVASLLLVCVAFSASLSKSAYSDDAAAIVSTVVGRAAPVVVLAAVLALRLHRAWPFALWTAYVAPRRSLCASSRVRRAWQCRCCVGDTQTVLVRLHT
jgi:predicted permease